MKILVLAVLGVLSSHLVQAQFSSDTCNPKPGQPPFVSVNKRAAECGDVLEECTQCTQESRCQDQCRNDFQCHGYIWESRLLRCILYKGCVRGQGSIEYFEKNCESRTKSLPVFRRRSDGEKENIGRGPSMRPILDDICPKKCKGGIPEVQYAVHRGKNTNVGSVVPYYCLLGQFVNPNVTTVTCQNDQEWSTPLPQCDPMVNDY